MGALLQQFGDWLLQVLLWVPAKIFEGVLIALAALLNSIPVPAFFSNAATGLNILPSQILYWIGPFEFAYGVSAVLTAHLLRFLIRRIPMIG